MRKAAFLLLVLVSACASVTTSYDHDKSADFKKGMTYTWDKHVQAIAIDQLNKDRIISAIEKEMTARGYSKSDNADFLVDFHVKLEQDQSATATTTGGRRLWPQSLKSTPFSLQQSSIGPISKGHH